ncbi:cupin domain-containing protein [Mycobacterium sp.]|uniref:cupin domain-containing protein n=1 Tax=Mycobacterium sp. TaxID=1785 RepID=UPI002D0F124B|nr:cupin domain-containing protein [Mycobacterium sp.]HKP40897.1 cupin domain-containing protein [Mycobacterium sp.]
MRRVVTGHDSRGRSVVVDDGVPPRTHEFISFPGCVTSVAWATEPGEPVSKSGEDPTGKTQSLVPGPGGTRLMVLTFPPDAVMGTPAFDGPGFVAEQFEHGPGLAERFEPDGMHTTPTVDYVIVVDGEIWLELDDGHLTHLRAGDAVVQNATRHGWRNRSDKPATLAVILTGADVETTS